MKKTLSVIFLTIFLLLCGCGKTDSVPLNEETPRPQSAEPTPAPLKALRFFMDIQYYEKMEGDRLLCRVEYPVLRLDSEDSVKYPALSNALNSINSSFIQNGQTVYSQLCAAAQQSYLADSENIIGYQRSTSVVLPRCDSRAVSILYRSAVSSGGDTTDVSYSCSNRVTATGRQLDIRDVVTDLPALRNIIEAELPAKYPDVEFYDLINALNRYMADPTQFVWTVDYQGITLYFNPYELADASAGVLSVSLRYESYPEILVQDYAEVPGAYSVPLVDGQCLNFDLDLNGASDRISVYDTYNEKLGYSDVLTISINGNETTTKTGLRGYECYVIHAGLGRNYLLINGENLSDYGYVNVFRIDRTGASFVGGLYDTSLQCAGRSGYCEGKPILTDPESFMLGSKCTLIREQPGVKTYHIGADGMPISDEGYFLLDPTVVVTSKNEISTVSIDPATGSGNQGAVKIPAKTEFYFWRTDAVSCVDMKTSTGVCCRLFVNKGNTQFVNGTNVNDIFE